jgi:hypothetical protein
VDNLETHVARCEREYPGKAIVLGTCLFDYGRNPRMPKALLERQYEIALRLLHAGRIVGIEITTIPNDPEALVWTADWIRCVGPQPLKSR